MVFLLLVSLVSACDRGRPPAICAAWPLESPGDLGLTGRAAARHLHDDAVRAEDYSIRYADSLKLPRSKHFTGWPDYTRMRDTCLRPMYEAIARNHHVQVVDVTRALDDRPFAGDALVILSFALIFGTAVWLLAASLPQRFPLGSARETGVAIFAAVGLALILGLIGTGVGEFYSGWIESFRMNSWHLSNRAARIPFQAHRGAAFLLSVSFALCLEGLRYLRKGDANDSRHSRRF